MFRYPFLIILAAALGAQVTAQTGSPTAAPRPAATAAGMAKRCQIKLDQDAPEAAEPCYRLALGRFPGSPLLHEGLAQSLEQLRRPDDAEAEFRKADGFNSHSRLLSFAERLSERNDSGGAIRIYESLIPAAQTDSTTADSLVGQLRRNARWHELGVVCKDYYKTPGPLANACRDIRNLDLDSAVALYRADPSSVLIDRQKLTHQLVNASRLKESVEVCAKDILHGCGDEISYLFRVGRKADAVRLADALVEEAQARGEKYPYLQLSNIIDQISDFSTTDILLMNSVDSGTTLSAGLAATTVSVEDRLQLCLEAINHGDNIDFVLGNFLQKMNYRGQLTEAVDALRRMAPGLAIDSISFHIGNDDLGRLLYQGYLLLAAQESVPLADQSCNFGAHPPIPAGSTARLDYTGTVSCKNDSWGGAKILVEYQQRIWIANASGFHYVVAPADATVRPFMAETFEQAIARVTGGRGESDTPMDELALGLQARQGILAKQKPLSDPGAEATGTRAFTMLMSTPIAKSGKVAGFDLTLLDDPSVNAFSTAGGHIYVDKGMLPIIGNDTGLWSAVIAHEAGHVVAHHQYKAYLRAMSLKATRDALQRQAAAGNKYAGWAYLFSLAGGHVLNMKLSRDDELEADRLGLMMIAQAGIHPDYAEVLMQRLHRVTGDRGKVAAFLLSDHPRWETREKKIRRAREEAMSVFNKQYASAANSPGGLPPLQ